jgi:hypothetical protein
MAKQYVRVRYLKSDGHNAPMFDSCVLAPATHDLAGTVRCLLESGFTVPAAPDRSPDEEEIIMPGAIMSVTPCNERGWSKHDNKRSRI